MRVQAGVLHVLRESADQGHCFLPLTPLKRNAAGLLGVEEDPVEAAVAKLASRGQVVLQEADDGNTVRVYPAELFYAEKRVAEALQKIYATPSSLREEKLLSGWSKPGVAPRGIIDLTSPELFGPAAIRLDPEQARAVERANVVVVRSVEEPVEGRVAVVSAGTSDLPIADETALVAEAFGLTVERVTDVGVAGIHRILDRAPALAEMDCVIVVAGMEGALPSVVAGLVPAPVIAVPTSVGYGASFDGLAALLGMLSSCVPGVLTVNIDNGVGAAMAAHRILRGR